MRFAIFLRRRGVYATTQPTIRRRTYPRRWKRTPANIRHPYRDVTHAKIVLLVARGSATISSPPGSIRRARSSASGATGAGSFRATRGLQRKPVASSISMPGRGRALCRRSAEADEFVISAYEKPSVWARAVASIRHRRPAPGRPMCVEHEYYRMGALTYLAAWDVHRAILFGRCESPFELSTEIERKV